MEMGVVYVAGLIGGGAAGFKGENVDGFEGGNLERFGGRNADWFGGGNVDGSEGFWKKMSRLISKLDAPRKTHV